jgi:hypothetical protein
MSAFSRLAAACLAAVVGVLVSAADLGSRALQSQVAAFVDVNVVPMDEERVLPSQTVVVRDGRIAQIGPASSTAVPEGALSIDGRGKYLMPGLVDMHIHVLEANVQEELFLYLANGVTTVRHLRGRPEFLKLRQQIASGQMLGPTLYTCGPIVFGDKKPDAARRIVDEQAKAGYDCIKIYDDWSKDGYEALIAAANAARVAAVGHLARNLPRGVPPLIGRAVCGTLLSSRRQCGYRVTGRTAATSLPPVVLHPCRSRCAYPRRPLRLRPSSHPAASTQPTTPPTAPRRRTRESP